MAFWGTDRLNAEDSGFSVSDLADNAISEGTCRLRLGKQVFVTPVAEGWKVPDREIRQLEIGQTVDIPPGQFAYLLTHETITLPSNAIGLISMKLEAKMLGLVNVSGFHVDPGYSGKLIFAVWNAGPQNVSLKCGEKLFRLWLADISPQEAPYTGKAFNEIRSDTLNKSATRFTSLYQLRADIDELKRKYDKLKIYGGILIAVLALPILKNIGEIILPAFPVTSVESRLSAPNEPVEKPELNEAVSEDAASDP